MAGSKKIQASKLVYRDVTGAGKQIYAEIDKQVNCIEFTLNSGWQPVGCAKLEIIGYEPWIQFKPKEWKEMVDRIFTQMVESWNEKYAL